VPWGATVELHPPFVACGASNPLMHRGCAWHKFRNELVSDIGDEHPRFIRRLPKVSFSKASFKMEGVSPDAMCRAHRMGGSLLGRPAVMSSLAMVMDASVLTVTNNGLSPIQPWAIRPLLALSDMIWGMGWGNGNGDTSIRLFHLLPLVFRWSFCIGSCLFSMVFSCWLPLVCQASFFPAGSLFLLECRSSLLIGSCFFFQRRLLFSSDSWSSTFESGL
jgi:hypothetical protein